MKLLTAREMREIDSRAIHSAGIPSLVLMENASRGSARWFRECFPAGSYTHAVVFAGSGNNGGDGMAVARILTDWGVSVIVCLMADPSRLSTDAALQHKIITGLGIPVHLSPDLKILEEIMETVPPGATFLVDALLGTGITRPVTGGALAAVIRKINESDLPVAAVDMPSGLSDAFPREEGLCVRANCTATFHALKTAHLYPDGNDLCGRIRIIDIGIPAKVSEDVGGGADITGPEHAIILSSPRRVNSHKGDYGHVLAIAGSPEKPGAGMLSAYAALRGGAGLSTLALSEKNVVAAGRFPEVMTLFWKETSDLIGKLGGFDCIAAGPGLGTGAPIPELVERLLVESPVPLVLDADALNVLAGNMDALKNANCPVVITPHPLEFSRLSGRPLREILADRLGSTRGFAGETGVFVVLKGHHTVVASPLGRLWVNGTGNPGMATAGSGDVLTGFLAAQIARLGNLQDLDEICAAAVYSHGRAGDLARRERGETGMTAGDILEQLPAAIRGIHDDPGPFSINR